MMKCQLYSEKFISLFKRITNNKHTLRNWKKMSKSIKMLMMGLQLN